jgi:hypothetical protein
LERCDAFGLVVHWDSSLAAFWQQIDS